MDIVGKKLKGAFEITLKPLIDERGFFMRTFDDKIFEEAGLKHKWVQENHSRHFEEKYSPGIALSITPVH